MFRYHIVLIPSMDCSGFEPGLPSVVTFISVTQLGRVLCLFVASHGTIFSFLCTIFIYVTFVTCHKEIRLEMLDENAEPFVSQKRKDPRPFAPEFVGKSKCAGSPPYLICENIAVAKT